MEGPFNQELGNTTEQTPKLEARPVGEGWRYITNERNTVDKIINTMILNYHDFNWEYIKSITEGIAQFSNGKTYEIKHCKAYTTEGEYIPNYVSIWRREIKQIEED